jgi:hypothetical protein
MPIQNSFLGQSGFTLVELALYSSLFLMICFAAFSLGLSSLKDYEDQKASWNALNTTLLAEKFISKTFSSIGGSGLPASSSILVENNCSSRLWFPDCQGSDRVTLVKTTTTKNLSGYAQWELPQPFLKYDNTSKLLYFSFDPLGNCTASSNLVQKHFVLYNSSTDEYFHAWSQTLDQNDCTILVEPDQQGSALSSPTLTSNPNFVMNNGIIFFVQYETLLLNSSKHQLISLSSKDNITAQESVVAEDVYDFQLTLRYINPSSGKITDDGTELDTILYNDPLDTFAGLGGTNSGISKIHLRSLGTAMIILKNTNPIRPTSKSIFDGPVIDMPNAAMVIQKDFYFRNNSIFR